MGTVPLLDEILEANARPRTPQPAAPGGFIAGRKLCIITCVDPRLTRFFPTHLGVERGDATVFRVPGAAIRAGSMMLRSVAAILYVNKCEEVLVMPHTDCGAQRTTAADLADAMRKRGVPRDAVDGDLREFFGLVGDVRQAALDTVKAIREAAFVPRGLPVHAALIDIESGQLTLIERGYDAAAQASRAAAPAPTSAPATFGATGPVKFASPGIAPAPQPAKAPAQEAPLPTVTVEAPAPQSAPAGMPAAPRGKRKPNVEIALESGRAVVEGTAIQLPLPLTRSLLRVRDFLRTETSASERRALAHALDEALDRGAGAAELARVAVKPILDMGQKRYAVLDELLAMKEESSKLSPPLAWAALRSLAA